MSSWLLDTGPLVAALDRRDPHHARCTTPLAAFAGTLLTTGAVVTEAMHFLCSAPDGAATLVLLAEEANISEILTLDERGFRTYRDRGSWWSVKQ